MRLFARLTIYAAVLCCVTVPAVGTLWAADEDKGQEDLSLATETKLSAENISDLGEVIRLCESAMKKGLGADNTQFARHLLAATLVQRAEIANKIIMKSGGVDPQWAEYRRVALADLEKAVSLVPEEPEALVLIAKLNLLPGGDRKRSAEALDKAIAIKNADTEILASALVLRSRTQEDAKKRLADLQEALRLEPQMAEALRARGFHYATAKQSEKALADLKAAEKIEPNHPSTIEAMALLLSRMEKFDEALECLAKLQKLQPKSIAPLLIEVRIHAVRSDMDKALKCLNRALELQPANPDVLLLRASLYTELKQPEKAMADVDRVLQLEPKHEKARRVRAMLLAKTGKIDSVVDELESILKAKPDDLNVQMQLGMLYTMRQQPKKAIAAYSKVLAKMPDNVDALIGRASALLTVGKHVESIADYEKAAKLDADDPGMLNNFAWVLATSPEDKLRNGPRAVELATKACKLTDYQQAYILSTLAAAHAETGDFKSALKWSKKAIELGKQQADKDTQEALEKEHKSFESGKPWRERLSEKDLKPLIIKDETPPKPNKPDAKKDEKKPAEPKAAKPDAKKDEKKPAEPKAAKPDAKKDEKKPASK